MKFPPNASIALACLVIAACAKAGPTPQQLPHEHLKFVGAKTTYDIVTNKPGETVRVTKTALVPDPSQKLQWEFEITSSLAEPHSYSLLSVGVQTVIYDVKIVSAEPAGVVKFAKLDDAKADRVVDPANGLLVPKTDTITVPGTTKKTVNDANIWFIAFTGTTCKVVVEVLPDREFTTEWTKNNQGFRDSHRVEAP